MKELAWYGLQKNRRGGNGNSLLVHKGCCEEESRNLPSASTGDRSRCGGVRLLQRKCIKIFWGIRENFLMVQLGKHWADCLRKSGSLHHWRSQQFRLTSVGNNTHITELAGGLGSDYMTSSSPFQTCCSLFLIIEEPPSLTMLCNFGLNHLTCCLGTVMISLQSCILNCVLADNS